MTYISITYGTSLVSAARAEPGCRRQLLALKILIFLFYFIFPLLFLWMNRLIFFLVSSAALLFAMFCSIVFPLWLQDTHRERIFPPSVHSVNLFNPLMHHVRQVCEVRSNLLRSTVLL